MSIEEDMSRLVSEFEDRQQTGLSEGRMIREITNEQLREGKTLEQIASDPDSLTYGLVKLRYPDILERELLAAALDRKYNDPDSPFSQEFEKIYEVHEAAIEQGHEPPQYQKMKKQRLEIADLVTFLTRMNDTEIVILEKQWQKEAEEEKFRAKIEDDRRETLEKYSSYTILVPIEDKPGEHVEQTLEQYVTNLAKKVLSEKIESPDELPRRIEHIRANLNFVIDPWMRKYITEEYERRLRDANKELGRWQSEKILHELEPEQETSLNQAQKAYFEARIARDIIIKIIG